MAETASEERLSAADLASGEPTAAADLLYGRQEGINTANITSAEGIATERSDTQRFVALVGAYTSKNRMEGISTKGGWKVKVSEGESTFGPEGMIVGPPVLIATRGASSWQQLGDKMFRAGGGTSPKLSFNSVEDERVVVDFLMSKLGNKKAEQDFIDKYGYLPVRYFEALTMQAPGLPGFLKEFEMGPAYDMSGGSGGGTGGSGTGALSDARDSEEQPVPVDREPIEEIPKSDFAKRYQKTEGFGEFMHTTDPEKWERLAEVVSKGVVSYFKGGYSEGEGRYIWGDEEAK